jgi:hypothetical protein
MGEFREAVSGALSRNWQPMVQVHAQGRQEYTGIFVKGERGKFQLLIATIEAHDATVIVVRLNPAQLFDWLRSPAEMKARANSSSRDDDCCLEE